jgi:hypothetical protein
MSTATARSAYRKGRTNIRARTHECTDALIDGSVHMFGSRLLPISTAYMLDAREQVCRGLWEKERHRLQICLSEA